MDKDNFEDKIIYKVVVNHEEQYSIWPADRENALGWKDVDNLWGSLSPNMDIWLMCCSLRC